jgi:thiazole/oxazole-forming peptide maturase SagC family component
VSEPITLKTKKKEHLSKADYYGDQIRFFSQFSSDGQAAQKLLGKAQVVVFGAGAIGSQAIAALADAGVGKLRVIDQAETTKPDIASNALLQLQDVGQARAECAAQRVNEKNIPSVNCEAVQAESESDEKLKEILHGATCVLVCLDSPAPALLDAVNRAALEANVRWITGQIYRGAGILGPTVIPYQSACYKCYELRRNTNLENYEEVMHYESRLRQMPAIRSEFVAPKPLAHTLGGLLALESLRLMTQTAIPQMAGRILLIDFFAPEMTSHRLLRLPNCPACGKAKRSSFPIQQEMSR